MIKKKIETIFSFKIYIICNILFLACPILFTPPHPPNFNKDSFNTKENKYINQEEKHFFENEISISSKKNETIFDFLIAKKIFIHFLILFYFYFNYLYLYDNFWYQKKYKKYFLITLVYFICFYLTPIYLWDYFRIYKFHHNLLELQSNITLFILSILLVKIIKINQHKNQIIQQKINAELQNLKLQINPHFLFNTLNSIYSMALNKSVKTSDAILNLANMMRYVLTETNNEKVSLIKEIDYIDNYILLQKLRFENVISIIYNKPYNISNELMIAPILIMPFIENAFKYGIFKESNNIIQIHIFLDINNKLDILIENNYNKNKIFEGNNIGIKNVQNRLHLLYPNKHYLQIIDKDNLFKIILKIDLE